MTGCEWCQAAPATVQIVELVSGARRTVRLCTPCATRTRGEGRRLHEWLAAGGSPTPTAALVDDQVACPGCGLTAAAWLASGRLGCSECYEAFAEMLRSLVPALAQDLPHLGRRPDHAPPAAVSRRTAAAIAESQLAILERELQEAVAREDFERAATLRDELAQRRANLEQG